MRYPASSPGLQGRNALCACGSGRKYKLCCGAAARPGAADAPIATFDRATPGAAAADTLTEAGRISRSADLLWRELESRAGSHARATLPRTGTEGQARPDPHPVRSANGPPIKSGAGSLPQGGKGGVDVRAAQELHQRALQLLHAGQAAAAIPLLRKAVVLDARNAMAHRALGRALLENQQFAEAASSLSRAVGLQPGLAIAYQDLGYVLERQGLELEAIAAYQRAVALAPKLADVHRRLGELHLMHGRTEPAIACFNNAAAAAPDTTMGRIWRANALILAGNMGAAEPWLRKAVALDPTSHHAHTALAGLLISLGSFEAAIEHYEVALRLNPSSAGPWNGIARARRFTAADRPLLGRMQAVLGRERLCDEERMRLHFALGKAHDDLGDYAEAMQHFDAGNGVRSRSHRFERAGFAALLDRLIERFTPELFEQLAGLGDADETPLLIVGMPRSGTTLVEQIVSCHPAVAAGGELSFLGSHGTGWECAEGPGFTPDAARSWAAAYLALLRKIGASATRVTDKTPANYLRLGLIRVLLPNARIIHCRRHPVDTCLSIYSTLFSSRMDFAGSKADLVFVYRQYVRLMSHWRAVLPPDRFLEVEYERLIADREAETRRLIAFAGLGWNEACLQPERNARTVITGSVWQARQPVYGSSVERWRRYQPWLGELLELLADGTRRQTTGRSPA